MLFSSGMPHLIFHSTSGGLLVSFVSFCCQEAISNIVPT